MLEKEHSSKSSLEGKERRLMDKIKVSFLFDNQREKKKFLLSSKSLFTECSHFHFFHYWKWAKEHLMLQCQLDRLPFSVWWSLYFKLMHIANYIIHFWSFKKCCLGQQDDIFMHREYHKYPQMHWLNLKSWTSLTLHQIDNSNDPSQFKFWSALALSYSHPHNI